MVFPAIILHDVGWKFIPEDLQTTAFGPGEKDMDLNRVHEVEGARIAGEILARLNYRHSLINEIREIILGHDSRKQEFPRMTQSSRTRINCGDIRTTGYT